jgi:hypothetical protein
MPNAVIAATIIIATVAFLARFEVAIVVIITTAIAVAIITTATVTNVAFGLLFEMSALLWPNSISFG